MQYLLGISLRRKSTRKSRGSRGETSKQAVPQPLIIRFASTFATHGNTQMINQSQAPILGQQQQGDDKKNNTVEGKCMIFIRTSAVKPTKIQE